MAQVMKGEEPNLAGRINDSPSSKQAEKKVKGMKSTKAKRGMEEDTESKSRKRRAAQSPIPSASAQTADKSTERGEPWRWQMLGSVVL